MTDIHARQFRFMQNVAHLINYCFQNGYQISAGELYRTEYQQAEYVRTGLSQTMDSMHRRRLAIDLNIFINEILINDKSQIEDIGQFWIDLHPDNRWGGNFTSLKDIGHFEMRDE